jgi:hypothetical protein
MAVLVAGCGESQTNKLPALGAKIDETSVSGISSGAYMAGQFEFAESKRIVGAAIIAGGPYGCAESVFADIMPGPGTALLNMSKAMNGCMQNGLQMFGIPDPKHLAAKARQRAERGEIDPVSNVLRHRIYLFSGKEDHTVLPAIVASAAEFYAQIGTPSGQVKLVTEYGAGHGFVTDDKGATCDRSGTPYVVDCDYDQAGALLTQIYGPLKARSETPSGRYLTFDQDIFTSDLPNAGLGDKGVVYIPSTCANESGCRVHIAFHGCAQNRASVDDKFITESGFSRWADTNRLIVLFPQTANTPLNPQGCWDWWGYSSNKYLTRSAPQIVAVRRMLERLGYPLGTS